jgi:hypothetical protein
VGCERNFSIGSRDASDQRRIRLVYEPQGRTTRSLRNRESRTFFNQSARNPDLCWFIRFIVVSLVLFDGTFGNGVHETIWVTALTERFFFCTALRLPENCTGGIFAAQFLGEGGELGNVFPKADWMRTIVG